MLSSLCIYWPLLFVAFVHLVGGVDLNALYKKGGGVERIQGSLMPPTRTKHIVATEGLSWSQPPVGGPMEGQQPDHTLRESKKKKKKPLEAPETFGISLLFSYLNHGHNHSSVKILSRLTANNQIV